MENTARKIDTHEQARVVGHIQLETIRPAQSASPVQADRPLTDESFLTQWSATTSTADSLRREHQRVIAEISLLQTENRWQAIADLFHPVDSKVPELAAAAMDTEIRSKVAFALTRLERNDEAIETLQQAIRQEPNNGRLHYSLGYAALNELFTAKTKRRIIPGKRRKELIDLAHTGFSTACALRPQSVTFCYRQAILYKEIEGKTRQAIPLFEQAVANWEQYSEEEQQHFHQQRPKYVKSLYHLASCLLEEGRAGRSLQLLNQLEREDQGRNILHPLFRHFAFGKVLHALERYKEALEHLETADQVADRHQPTDFVWELAARCALRLQQVDRAAACINRIPAERRRPYVRWTEADVLAAAGRTAEAMQVLRQCSERDRRARHVALIRLSRLHLNMHQYEEGVDAAERAVRFCEETYGNPSKEAQFWQAAGLHLLGKNREALQILLTLEEGRFQYPHFRRLIDLVRAAVPTGPRT
ncbi:MAG: tetratricopeptide repeat protein [Desulfobulbus sp.]|nr:tetratricopeptide repeat protein [Desulfobulbus sp.]